MSVLIGRYSCWMCGEIYQEGLHIEREVPGFGFRLEVYVASGVGMGCEDHNEDS